MMTVHEIIEEALKLSEDERRIIIKAVAPPKKSKPMRRTHSIMDFFGVGAAYRDPVDAQERVNQLRAEWDEDEDE